MHASFQTGCHDSMDVLWVAFISLHTMKKISHRSTTERRWRGECRVLDTLSKSRRAVCHHTEIHFMLPSHLWMYCQGIEINLGALVGLSLVAIIVLSSRRKEEVSAVCELFE